MDGASPAEGHQGEPPRIDSFFNRVNARGVGHILIDHLVDPPGGPFQGQIERPGDLCLQCGFGKFHVEFHFAAQEKIRDQVTQDEVGIGHRRLLAPEAVAGRAGVGPGAFRAYFQETQGANRGDAPAPCSDLDHLDDRDFDRQPASFLEAIDPAHLEFVDPQRIAVLDDTSLGGGPPHVEGHDVILPRLLPDPGGSEGASRGSGFDQTDGILAGSLRRGDSPI